MVKVKVCYNNDIRLWRYPVSKRYDSLIEFVEKAFHLVDGTFSLQYEDDEGDRITFSNESDLEYVLDSAGEDQRKSLKIFISKKAHKQNNSSKSLQSQKDCDENYECKDEEIIHNHVQCDGCNAFPIRGIRYKCGVCSDFDICSNCEANKKHDPTHPFVKITRPLSGTKSGFAGLYEILGCRFRGRHPCRYQSQSHPFFGHHNSHSMDNICAQSNEKSVKDNIEPDINISDKIPKRGKGEKGEKKRRSKKLSAEFVKDVTLPDGTSCIAGTIANKIWRIKNTSDIEWNGNVELKFLKGSATLALEKRYPIPNAKPEEEIDVTAMIRVPKKVGRYCSYFRLSDGETCFGPRIWVDIYSTIDENNPDNKIKGEKVIEEKEKKIQERLKKIQKLRERLEKTNSKIDGISQQESDSSESQNPVQEGMQIELKPEPIDNIIQDKQNNEKDNKEQILCICGSFLVLTTPSEAYSSWNIRVNCDICAKYVGVNNQVYHCPKHTIVHPNGYDMCCDCVKAQILKIEEPVIKIEEQVIKVEEPVIKVEEPVIKVEELVIKAEKPVIKVEEPIIKNEEPIIKNEEPIIKNEEPVSKCEEPIINLDESIIINDLPVISNVNNNNNNNNSSNNNDWAKKIMNSFKNLVNSNLDVLEQPKKPFLYQNEYDVLVGMGFNDEERLKEVLLKYGGDISHSLEELFK